MDLEDKIYFRFLSFHVLIFFFILIDINCKDNKLQYFFHMKERNNYLSMMVVNNFKNIISASTCKIKFKKIYLYIFSL